MNNQSTKTLSNVKTLKFIFILVVLVVMLFELGGCTSQSYCPTYTTAYKFYYKKPAHVNYHAGYRKIQSF